MLGLEDLLAANLAVRQGQVQPEVLRPILEQLDGRPERASLLRHLHEQQLLAIDLARGIHEAVQRRLRRLGEDAYAAQVRAHGAVPPEVLAGLREQLARDDYAWSLGERLVREHGLPPDRHHAFAQAAHGELARHEANVREQNRSARYAPTLGVADSDRLMATSGELAPRPAAPPPSPAPSPPGPGAGPLGSAFGQRPPAGGGSPFDSIRSQPSPYYAGAGPAAGPDDGERTISLDNPLQPFGGGAPDPDRTVTFGPGGPDAGPGPDDVVDAGRTIRFQSTLPTPGGAGEEADRTIDLPAGSVEDARAAGGGPNPFRTVGMQVGGAGGAEPPTSDQTIKLSAEDMATSDPGAGSARIHERFEVVRELGRGNMGVVYLARDPDQGGRFVAVKLVQGAGNDEARARFRREILVSRRMQHEHVIEVFDAGELPDGSSFMVMEYLEGEELRDVLERTGALPVERALEVFEQLLRGLAAVHEGGIVHRDLKPENLQVLQRFGGDHIKLMDFGISRFLDDAEVEEPVFVTMKGTLSGTPAYVAPEAVLEPEKVLTSHDVYACGVILYELLTGQLPFPADRSLKDILADTLHSRPKPLAEARPEGSPWPKPLEALVNRLLEKAPETRPADGGAALAAFLEARRELEEGPRAPKRRRRNGAASRGKEGITKRLLRAITSVFKRGPVEDD